LLKQNEAISFATGREFRKPGATTAKVKPDDAGRQKNIELTLKKQR